MNTIQVEDEFVAVRVQDPRMQNEGSWNSYVDYKIFLHTNSKAFTAKTSCVRRRYSEFVWLRKKLQKNAGLVPVPELPGKSFFSFSNDDFLERRRKGLQVFLDRVVHMTVCLSDSQLHLFLQTQLPVCHIQDCVQGHTPYTVTDAILTYASSNWGLAQAQEDDCIKEPSLTVSYESMESPAPHQPCTQMNKETLTPELLSCGDVNPPEGLLERHNEDTAQLQHKEKPSVRISQDNHRLQAVVEGRPAGVSFYVGDDMESLSLSEQSQQRSCQIQTPVEVHSVLVAGFEEDCTADGGFEGCNDREGEETLDSEEKTDRCSQMEVKDDQLDSPEEANVDTKAGPVSDLSCASEPDNRKRLGSVSEEDELDVCAETDEVSSVPDVVLQVDQELDLVGSKDEREEDCYSLPSSNESIIKVSEDEGVCDEVDDSIQAANGYMETPPDVSRWSEVEASSRSVLDLQMDGCSVEREDISTQEGLQYVTSVDLHSAVGSGDWTESGDFSVLQTSGTPALADSKCAEQEALSSLTLDTSEEMYEVQVR